MNLLDFITHPVLGQYVKKAEAGEYLFRQGQIAKTMIFLIEGRIQLIGEKNDSEYIASIVEPGEILGEKAIIQETPYQRTFSAKTETDVAYLELGRTEIDHIEKADPSLIGQMLRGIIHVVAHRFDLANYLVKLLRSSNNVERLIHIVLYLSRCSGQRFPGGVQVILTPDAIHHYIDMDKERIQTALNDLVTQRLLIQEGDSQFLIPNEQALLEYVPSLIQRLAA